MTADDANKCLLVMLLFDRREWPPAQVEAWTQAVMRCADKRAAMAASEALVNETEPRDWSLHRWRQAYQEALRAGYAPALPRPEGATMSLSQYMNLLASREAAGNAAAGEELVVFRKYRDGKLLRGVA